MEITFRHVPAGWDTKSHQNIVHSIFHYETFLHMIVKTPESCLEIRVVCLFLCSFIPLFYRHYFYVNRVVSLF